jgi:hypothetical protein
MLLGSVAPESVLCRRCESGSAAPPTPTSITDVHIKTQLNSKPKTPFPPPPHPVNPSSPHPDAGLLHRLCCHRPLLHTPPHAPNVRNLPDGLLTTGPRRSQYCRACKDPQSSRPRASPSRTPIPQRSSSVTLLGDATRMHPDFAVPMSHVSLARAARALRRG